MTAEPPETARFEEGDLVEIRVNGRVVGRLEQRPESALTVEDEAAVALEVDQLVQSMNELLEDHHDVQSDGDERIAAEIVARRESTVEIFTSDHGEWQRVTDRQPGQEARIDPNDRTTDETDHTMTDTPPEATRFEDANYVEIKVGGEIVARVEQRPATAMTDSELAGLSLMLGSLVDDIADELADEFGRTPYEVLDETGTTVEVTATGTDTWVTRIE